MEPTRPPSAWPTSAQPTSAQLPSSCAGSAVPVAAPPAPAADEEPIRDHEDISVGLAMNDETAAKVQTTFANARASAPHAVSAAVTRVRHCSLPSRSEREMTMPVQTLAWTQGAGCCSTRPQLGRLLWVPLARTSVHRGLGPQGLTQLPYAPTPTPGGSEKGTQEAA